MKILVLFSIIALAFADNFDRSLDKLWHLYKVQYGKNLAASEEGLRRTIWEKNVQLITKHNLEYDLGMHTYRLGLNSVADLTPEEYRQLLGFKQGNEKLEAHATFMPPSNVADYPTSVDWRTKGYVTEVKNQASCGSCWAFSATGALEGQHFRKYGKLVSLSEQQLVDCSRAEGNFGCGGGWMDYAFQYVKDITAKGQFLDLEECYPYKALDLQCKPNFTESCFGTQCTGFVDIKKGDESDLLAAVATAGPVSVAIDAGHSSFQLYKDGVYNEPRCSSTLLNHGVLAVGYGSIGGSDYWIVKNSWGTSWGNKGYILMSRNKNNQCGIASVASYPLV